MSTYETYGYKSSRNVVYKCYYHVVWCPKYRRSVLYSGVDARLKHIVHEVCDECNAELVELEIMPGHVHLLAGVDPQFGIYRLIKRIKGRSSRILREEFPWLKSRIPSLWTNSYFVTTTGGAPLAAVKKYIETRSTYSIERSASSPRLKSGGASALRMGDN